jgi:hypothetical protein
MECSVVFLVWGNRFYPDKADAARDSMNFAFITPYLNYYSILSAVSLEIYETTLVCVSLQRRL